ncbi:MAG: hypothetical protein ACRBB6_12740 [Neptuniibacter sp.]
MDSYSQLQALVKVHNTDWDEWDDESYPQCNVKLNNPSDVFLYAETMLIERLAQEISH